MSTSRDLTVDGRARPGSGVGRFCCELINRGLPYETIARLARERFGGKTSIHCVRWYASKMRTGAIPAGDAHRSGAEYHDESGLARDLTTLQAVARSLARRLAKA